MSFDDLAFEAQVLDPRSGTECKAKETGGVVAVGPMTLTSPRKTLCPVDQDLSLEGRGDRAQT